MSGLAIVYFDCCVMSDSLLILRGMYDIVVIPTYNEKENIGIIIPEICAVVPDAHIVVVDDNSPDATAEKVRELMRDLPQLSLVERKKKEGLGAAYKDILSRLAHDRNVRNVITMDADGSHDPKYIPDLLRSLRAYDLAIGSRYVRGGGVATWERWRMLLSKFGNLYARTLTRMQLWDLTAGFIGVRRELLEKVDFAKIGSGGYAYQIEFKVRSVREYGARACEIPIMFHERREGESKLSRQIIREGIRLPIVFFLRSLWKKS